MIMSENVSSSVSNAQGQVISVQPVFPQNTIPQIIQGKTLGKSRDKTIADKLIYIPNDYTHNNQRKCEF